MRVAISSPVTSLARAAVAHLTDEVDARRILRSSAKCARVRTDGDAEIARQVAVPPLDLLHHRLPVAASALASSCSSRSVMPESAEWTTTGAALIESCTYDGGDVLPVADARDARAPNLRTTQWSRLD